MRKILWIFLLLHLSLSCTSQKIEKKDNKNILKTIKNELFILLDKSFKKELTLFGKERIDFLKNNTLPFMEMEDFYDLFFSGDTLKWKAFGKRAEIYLQNKKKYIIIKQVKLIFIKENHHKDNTEIRCDFAFLDAKTLNADLFGNIFIKTYDGKKLYTQYLHWDNKHRVLHTEREVKILIKKKWIRGKGFMLDYQKNQIAITEAYGGDK